MRVGKIGNPVLARLEVRDPKLAAAIDERSTPVDRSGRSERRMRKRIVLWSLAATASLVLVAVVAVPEIATRLAPLVPYPLERRLGAAIDAQVRASLDTRALRPHSNADSRAGEKAGRAAFDKLMGQLERAAGLPFPLKAAWCGGRKPTPSPCRAGASTCFKGSIDKAETPDELAGVIAHEIGHVAHRDGTRSVLQEAGLSLLFGMLLGDFVGGGAVVIAATTILKTSYSREVEGAADRYGVALMTKIGGDPRALGTILLRIAGTHPSGTEDPARSSRDQRPRCRRSRRWRLRRRRRGRCSTRRRNGRRSEAHLLRDAEGYEPMARRYIHSEPTSRLAIWARRIAGFRVCRLLACRSSSCVRACSRSSPRWRPSPARWRWP